MTKFNPYKTFAHDGKALSQYKHIPDVECTSCHKMFNTTMELIDRETGRCESCQKKASQESKKETQQEPTPIRSAEHELTPCARVYIKRNKIVVRVVHSSSGYDYVVTMFEGRAVGCKRTNGEDCPSYHYRKSCRHASMAVRLEVERDEKRTRENNFSLAMGY